LILLVGAFAALYRRARMGNVSPRLAAGLRMAALAGVLLVVSLGAGCNDYSYGPNLLPLQSGTPLGKYTIGLVGTLGNDTTVNRTATINLAVGS
jgi:hypothetical protein